jgi:RHS repeat-associated protein
VYDGNGNTVRECRDHGDPSCTTTGDHLRRYFWTDEDRLDAVIDGGGLNVTRFVYDATGDRVAKLGRGGVGITVGQFFALKGHQAATKHVFVGEARLATKLVPPPGWQPPLDAAPPVVVTTGGTNDNGCDPSGDQPQKCPVFPAPDPVTKRRWDETKVRPATYYYHPDHLGSTSWVTDQNGRVHEHVDYFPYGAVWRDPRSDSDGAPVRAQAFLFTGKELDEETGLYYFGARYYDPRSARWISSDPAVLGLAMAAAGGAGLGFYTCCQWNPVIRTDPDGLADTYMGPAPASASHTREVTSSELADMRKQAVREALRQQLESPSERGDDPLNLWYKLTHGAETATQYYAERSVDESRSGGARAGFAVVGTITGMFDPENAERTVAFVGATRGAPPRKGSGRMNAGPAPTNPIALARLPQTGKIRFVPLKGWNPKQPLPRGPQDGYLDRFGNEWVKGGSRTPGQPHEWDVQLGGNATPGMRQLSSDGSHVNVSLDGKVTH